MVRTEGRNVLLGDRASMKATLNVVGSKKALWALELILRISAQQPPNIINGIDYTHLLKQMSKQLRDQLVAEIEQR